MKILSVVGPTTSGKTQISVELALRFGGEIVSCDSVQIYRGFDIGTAKPSPEERRGVAHHMLDTAGPEEEWSAGRYAREARVCIEDVFSRGKLPIVTGGSGFYLRALTDGFQPVRGSDKPALSQGLSSAPGDWDFVTVGLRPARDELERRIIARTSAMLRNGLIEETQALLQSGVPPDCAPMRSIGYLQARAVLDGELTVEQARAEIVLRTRQYAKRQRTWFYNQVNAHWLDDFSQVDIKTIENMIFM